MKSRKSMIVKLVLLIALALVLIGGMIFMMKRHIIFGPKSISNNLVLDEDYHGNYDVITINSDASGIEVRSTNDNFVHVTIYGEQNRSYVNENGNQLNIEAKAKKCFGICFNFTMSKVVVYIPENYGNVLKITNKYGDISVDNFELANLDVNADCGDVRISKGQKVIVKNAYGDITIDRAKEVDVHNSCGNIAVDYLEKGNIENSYGNIHLAKIDGEVDIKASCGDISIDEAWFNRDSQIENSLGNISIGKTNEVYIDAKVSLGDIKINENYRHSDITLKVKNDCGDIRVSN